MIIDLPPSGVMIVRLWQRCRLTARVWIPIGKDPTAQNVKNPPGTQANLAGRWPDAASLMAHRMQTLDPDAPKAEPGSLKPGTNSHP